MVLVVVMIRLYNLYPSPEKKMDLNHPFFRKEKSFLKPPFLGFLCYVLGGEM